MGAAAADGAAMLHVNALVSLALVVATQAVVVWGVALIYHGLRGVPSLSAPRCGKCGYDLRGFAGEPPTRCAECGADLTRPGSVRLARLARQPARAAVGVILVCLPLLGYLGLSSVAVRRAVFYAPGSPQAIATQTNAQVIAGLSTTANSPWGWQELERRLTAGTLPPADVTAAIDQYIRYRSTPGTSGPLVWAEGFFKAADTAHLIPQPQFDRLADAFFGGTPTVTLAPTFPSGQRVPAQVQYGGPWDILGFHSIYALRSVAWDDGTPVSVAPAGNVPNDAKQSDRRLSSYGYSTIGATLDVNATPGHHTLVFTVDTGLIDEDTRRVFQDDNYPGQTSRWPSNVRRVAQVVRVPVTVTDAATPAIERVTDTRLPGWPPFALRRLVALPGDEGSTRITCDLDAAASKGIYSNFDAELVADGRRLRLGTDSNSGDQTWTLENTAVLRPPLPAGVNTVTVTLTPKPDRANTTPGVTRVWDVPIEFKDVPIRRLDGPARP